jgi:HEXXH motif-containing protein
MSPTAPQTHQLSQSAFDEIADGYGTASAVRELLAGQVSRRQIALRGALDIAGSTEAEAYFTLLTKAQECDPESVTTRFREPHLGAWTFAILRRLRGVWSGAVTDTDLAYLAAVAAVAAHEAGLDFRIEVPTDGGQIFLPGMGRASGLPDRAEIVSSGGRMSVGDVIVGDGSPGWRPTRRLTATVDGQTLTVTLEDADPYRDCHRLDASDALTDEEAEQWQRLLEGAWRILVRRHPRHAAGIGAGLMSLVPLYTPHASHGVNATSMDAFGAISLTTPVEESALAASILHEFQHAKLGGLLDLVPLYSEADSVESGHDRLYAPWRDDPRPLSGLVQGVYAFIGVTDFQRVQRTCEQGRKARFAEFEFARWRERVWRSHAILVGSGRFNAHGRRFLDRLHETQRPWQAEPVADEVAASAREAAEDHWIGWRMRNLRPDATAVAEFAAAWRAKAEPPYAKVPVDILPSDGRALVYNPRLDLTALSITDPGRFTELRSDPDALKHEAPDASTGDVALVAGEDEVALAAYLEELQLDTSRHQPWVGIALATRRLGGFQVDALVACPEVVFAVFRACDDTDPLAIVEWLAGVSADGGPASTP